MKIVLIWILLSFSASSMEYADIKRLANEEHSKLLDKKLLLFSRVGEYELKMKLKIHEQDKTIDLPKSLLVNKIVEGKYSVSISPISENETYYYVTIYDQKEKLYKRFQANPVVSTRYS